MPEEIQLPPLQDIVPGSSQGDQVPRPKKRMWSRRCHTAPALFNNSSDPAVFSSDDDPSVENYIQGRRKKRYVGSWYQQQPASSDSGFEPPPPPQAKRSFARQLDSGVWMGSDGVESEILDDVPQKPKAAPIKPKPLSVAEERALQKVQACVRNGEESIDLSSLGLTSLSASCILPLSELSIFPLVAEGVPFEQRDPCLRIYLSSNSLTRLSPSLFHLDNITSLSVRGNDLTEIPPAIGRLRNLEELNVSQNQLRYLPAELLELMMDPLESKLRCLQIGLNPFQQQDQLGHGFGPTDLDQATGKISQDLGRLSPSLLDRLAEKKPVSAINALYLGRSHLELTNSYGNHHTNFSLQRISPADAPAEAGPSPDEPTPDDQRQDVDAEVSTACAVPTLVEIVLRSCYKSPFLPHLSGMMPDDPPHLKALVEKAASQREEAELSCWKCMREIITPKVQWLEWWPIVTFSVREDRVVDSGVCAHGESIPFLRRGCSWGCSPGKEKELLSPLWQLTDPPKDPRP